MVLMLDAALESDIAAKAFAADDVGVTWRFALPHLVIPTTPLDAITLTGGVPLDRQIIGEAAVILVDAEVRHGLNHQLSQGPHERINATRRISGRTAIEGGREAELDPAVRTTWAGFSVGGAAAPSF